MQRLDQTVVDKALQTAPPSVPAASSDARPASAEGLTKLWLLAQAAWGSRWTAQMGELPVDDAGNLTMTGAMWARQLAGLRERQVLEAIDYFAGRRDWPPAVAEIRKRAFGIPEFAFVRAEITRPTCGFTRLVWKYLDHWMFTRADQRGADAMLRAAYDHAVERRMAWESFPPEPVKLAHEKRTWVAPPAEHREQVLERVRAEVGLSAEGEA